MKQDIGIVDLFSGSGGLGEGFASTRSADGGRPYRITASIEKDPAAHRTLRLRAFTRQFERPPQVYMDWLTMGGLEPDWAVLHPQEWAEAEAEARCAELGTPAGGAVLHDAIALASGRHGSRTVLIGGPPCQAYSVVGRARRGRVAEYVAELDERHFLYEEYVRALRSLNPAVFVMENVKGLLSSAVGGRAIFQLVERDLSSAGYELYALSPGRLHLGAPAPSDFIVQAEDHGIPQSRHRVIIVGIRHDVVSRLPHGWHPVLPRQAAVPIEAVIGDLPRIRSGLSRDDGDAAWMKAVMSVARSIRQGLSGLSGAEEERLLNVLSDVERDLSAFSGRGRLGLQAGALTCPADLAAFLRPGEAQPVVQHESRAHMAADLGRYLFAACWTAATGRSPKARDFPAELAPSHQSWASGKFSDRFRVQAAGQPATTIVSHIAKDGHYYIHYDPAQCRSLTVREAARIQTFPDDYVFLGNRTQCYVQVGNAVPPYLARQIANAILPVFDHV